MKKNLILLVTSATLAMTACNETTHILHRSEETPRTTYGDIRLSFAAPAATRTPESGHTEVWEKEVNEATVFVFDAAGEIKLRRSLPAAEITAASTTPISLVVPDATPGENYDFIIVANRPVASSVTTKESLLHETETDILSYNGPHAEVSTHALRPGGFAMTGHANAKINEGRSNVKITLLRLVGKPRRG